MRTPSPFRPLDLALAGALALGLAACNKKGDDHAQHPPAPQQKTPDPAPAPPTKEPAAPAAHGDHDPAHGGFVLMDATTRHLELVVKPDGAIELWLSDAQRKPLPASAATSATVTLTPPGGKPETVNLAKDAGDGFWAGKGGVITDPATMVKLEVAAPDYAQPYQIELKHEALASGADHGGEKGPHGGLVQAMEGGGKLELKAAPDGNFQLWLLDDKGAARPTAEVKARVKLAVADYAEVTLAPMGDHLHGKGAAIPSEHAAAVVIVEAGGKTTTARFGLHLEPGQVAPAAPAAGGGEHGHAH
jgi:hypothetical protein